MATWAALVPNGARARVREGWHSGCTDGPLAGVTVGVGTDTGAFLMPHDQWTLLEDLKAFVKSGCSPMRALQAATRDGARVLGLDAHLGTLQAGKFADFVAVEGDPLQDLDGLRQ